MSELELLTSDVLPGASDAVLNALPLPVIMVAADGKIAARGHKPVAITGEAANARTHLLRACSDAVLVGIGTVQADDPELTCRLPGLAAQSPIRVVLDRDAPGDAAPPGERDSARTRSPWPSCSLTACRPVTSTSEYTMSALARSASATCRSRNVCASASSSGRNTRYLPRHPAHALLNLSTPNFVIEATKK